MTPLLVPRDGVPVPIVDPVRLAALSRRLAAPGGPVAVDAERASGFRYGSRAYLVQLRRADVGTALLDPIPLGDLATLDAPLAHSEWVLHAANQDLPCLADIGLRPRRLFDTELAGRLAGLPRVGLGPLVEQMLGLGLAKGHGAADWSTRPLPADWLTYAALDVEVLIELRDAMADLLESQGKLDWAMQEFAAIVAAPPPPPRVDPWRRTSGIHKIRDTRVLAVVRELWYARDDLARRRDLAPHRVLPDSAIVAAASGEAGRGRGVDQPAGLHRSGPATRSRRCGGPRSAAAMAVAGRRAAAGHPARRRTAATGQVGDQGSGSRRPAHRGAVGAGPHCRRGVDAGREPDLARSGAPGHVDAAVRQRSGAVAPGGWRTARGRSS